MHPEVRSAIDRLIESEHLTGIDPFGFRPSVFEQLLPPVHFFYRNWFRTEAVDIQNVPQGRVLLIANHSGQLPYDGAMIGASMILDHDPPRVVRSMVEHFVPRLPFVSTLFTRAGQIAGTRANARRLLEEDNCVLVFPEGAAGVGKPWSRRYQLQRFGLGFMRLALATDTPIVPVSVVGAEEQLPPIVNIKPLARLLNVPAVRLSPTLALPLPVKYHLRFGAPLRFTGDPDDEDRVIDSMVQEVKAAIADQIAVDLAARNGVFS